jgi:acetyltransferase-like isoleucine patch superfamily enzyme
MIKSKIRNVISQVIKKLITPDLLLHFYKEFSEYNIKVVTSNFKQIGSKSHFQFPFLVKNPQYITIGDNFYSLYNLRLEAWDEYENQKFKPEIIIGNNVVLNSDCHIGCINRVQIGNNVMMASRVYISDHFHGNISSEDLNFSPAKRKLSSKGGISIGDNVWIGEGVCIMPGVHIGANAIIGANAVVTKNVPENAVVGGIPAKNLKLLS